ncbi:MAG: NAD(P)H-hydrate dehydratase [Sulfuricurvum sp.]
MQNIYDEVASLDRRCYESFGLSEDLLMEHAANGMASFIEANFDQGSTILVVCGGGNNGADGIALSRMLYADYDVKLLLAHKPKSEMAKIQLKRARAVGVEEVDAICECDAVVDAIYGTGFSGDLEAKILTLLEDLNSLKAFKIACDVPSAFSFCADVTLTMGGLKKSLFLDAHKDAVGEIKVLDLGVARKIYEVSSNQKMLDLSDLTLPHRSRSNTHKGSFGHLGVVMGEKRGAATISALTALRSGSGLVSVISKTDLDLPYELMISKTLPSNLSAIAVGMGLGSTDISEVLRLDLPLVVDADLFYEDTILDLLKRDRVVLTPHPKEFASLLKLADIADVSVEELQQDRFLLCERFARLYPRVTLVLKGANVIIVQNEQMFINPHGRNNLAKGGSGDVLSGLIGSLLAQGRSTLDAAIDGSLMLSRLSLEYDGASFSLTPRELIENIRNLK